MICAISSFFTILELSYITSSCYLTLKLTVTMEKSIIKLTYVVFIFGWICCHNRFMCLLLCNSLRSIETLLNPIHKSTLIKTAIFVFFHTFPMRFSIDPIPFVAVGSTVDCLGEFTFALYFWGFEVSFIMSSIWENKEGIIILCVSSLKFTIVVRTIRIYCYPTTMRNGSLPTSLVIDALLMDEICGRGSLRAVLNWLTTNWIKGDVHLLLSA